MKGIIRIQANSAERDWRCYISTKPVLHTLDLGRKEAQGGWILKQRE